MGGIGRKNEMTGDSSIPSGREKDINSASGTATMVARAKPPSTRLRLAATS